MEFKIKGLVVNQSNLSDNHKILSILTDNGTIQAVAYSAKSNKSPLLASAQYFCYSEFLLKESKGDLPQIKEADLIESFYKLRESVEKLEAATEICKFANKVMLEGISSEVPLKLILNTLYLLQTKDSEQDIKNICILKMMDLLGELEITDEITDYISKSEINKLYRVNLAGTTSKSIDKLVNSLYN